MIYERHLHSVEYDNLRVEALVIVIILIFRCVFEFHQLSSEIRFPMGACHLVIACPLFKVCAKDSQKNFFLTFASHSESF